MTAPWRDPRYRPSSVRVGWAAPGVLELDNPGEVAGAFATVNGPLDHWADRTPDGVWLAERSGAGWRTLGFGAARDAVAALAGGLEGLGVGPGRPLLVLARNGIDTAIATYAAMRLGAPAAPVSPQYGLPGADPARLAHALALLRPAAAFVDDFALFGPALDGFEGAVVAAAKASGRALARADLQRSGTVADRATGAQPAKLLLTSGSTGAPKAVVNTHANLAVNAAQIAACYDDPDPPVTVNASPWSHSLGANALLHYVLHRGGTMYVDAGQPTPARFAETLRNLGEVRSTYHNMVPAGWMLLADALERDDALAHSFFADLRVMQYGGAGLPQSVMERIGAAGVRATGERITFAAGYGVTETAPTAMNVHWPNATAGLLGHPVPGTAARLVPMDGRLELRIRGPQVSPGYRLADGTLRPLELDEDGFYPTGDAVAAPDLSAPVLDLLLVGRLSENFKLATGAFVGAGPLRLAALSAVGATASDFVVCGEGREGVGLLVFLNRRACVELAGGEAEAVHTAPAVRTAVRAGIARMNAAGRGVGGRVARVLLLDHAPDSRSGELTDKGYLNQALARARRTAEIERLFAERPGPDVIDMAAVPAAEQPA